jgi:hypothetical protein
MDPLTMGIGFGVSLLSNLFSGESEQEKAVKAINAKINSIKAYSSEDMVRRSKLISNAGNTAIMSTANDFAIKGGSKQNFVQAGVSRMLPHMAELVAKQRIKDEDYNQNLPLLQAQAMTGTLPYESKDSDQSNFLSTIGLGLKFAGVADQMFQGFNFDSLLGNEAGSSDDASPDNDGTNEYFDYEETNNSWWENLG